MKVIFMGTPDFAVPSLQTLITEGYDIRAVVTQPDRPKGRKKERTPPPVKREAVKHGLLVLQPEKLRHSPELEDIFRLEPDLVITAAYGQILPRSVLETPEYGCINVHASLLPKYRGGAPIHKAIIEGESQTGITIMNMVEELDAGDILTQVKVPIGPEDDAGTMHDKLSLAGAELLSGTLPKLISGNITPTPQNEAEATYAPNISREDERLDWSKNSEQLFNQVRGLRPFPVAYMQKDGKNVKVWRARIDNQPTRAKAKDPSVQYVPGTIYHLREDGIGVLTGDGKGLLIEELQPSGKKRMKTADFLRGAGQSWKEGQRVE